MTIIEKLVEFGLSNKEARVYVALLELDTATGNEIARASKINRSSTYVVLDSLIEKGIVGVSDDKTVRRYVASPPEVIRHSAEDFAKKQIEILKRIDGIVPELKALYKGTKHNPKVRVYEGKNGLITAFENSLQCREKLMRVSSSVQNLMRVVPEYFPEYVRKRHQAGIKMHGIHPYDTFTSELIKKDVKHFDTPILIPKNKYRFPADLAIYDDRIEFMSAQNGGVAIIIEDKLMSDVMKSIFDLAFQEAKRIAKK